MEQEEQSMSEMPYLITLDENSVKDIDTAWQKWRVENPNWKPTLEVSQVLQPTVVHINEVIKWLAWLPEDDYQNVLSKINELRSK